ncbi:MAG: hypothetical protein ACOCQO_01305 [Halanaerobiaceae bacterium]
MKKPLVYVTRKLPQQAMDMIANECEMKVNPYERVMNRSELETAVKGIDGLLCLLTDTIDKELLDINPAFICGIDCVPGFYFTEFNILKHFYSAPII